MLHVYERDYFNKITRNTVSFSSMSILVSPHLLVCKKLAVERLKKSKYAELTFNIYLMFRNMTFKKGKHENISVGFIAISTVPKKATKKI